MDQKIELTELDIQQLFPLLKNDHIFKITSKATPRYNCIAWAYYYDDRWMQYDANSIYLDGVNYWWPDGVSQTPYLESYIEAFSKRGFSICDSYVHEEGYLKIALYEDKQHYCTHAAREKGDGVWTSKLGRSNDIIHESPYTIEGNAYGRVACIMKRRAD